MLIGGIDPGKNGAITFLRPDLSIYSSYSFDHFSLRELSDTIWGVNLFRGIRHIFMEQVHSMKGDGHVGAHTFGKNVGHWEGILTANHLEYELVSPQRWQTSLKCLTRGDKNISKAKALSLYPEFKITHANADSILIAHWGALKPRFNSKVLNQ